MLSILALDISTPVTWYKDAKFLFLFLISIYFYKVQMRNEIVRDLLFNINI